MNNDSIEKAQVALRFAQAGKSYPAHAVIQKQIAQHLMRLISTYLPDVDFNRVFEIGCGSGNLTYLLLENLQVQQLYLNDLYNEVQQHFQHRDQIKWLIGDAEHIDFPENLDLIASSSALQWMSDLSGILKTCRQSLSAQGYFCFSTFGQQNLKEIKALTGQGLHYFTVDDIRVKLEASGFEILHVSEQIETLYFDHPRDVLQHLKATGVTATASKFRWNKQSLAKFYQDYRQFLSSNQQHLVKYELSYHPIYIIARRIE